jgi:hypothetical protein
LVFYTRKPGGLRMRCRHATGTGADLYPDCNGSGQRTGLECPASPT